MKYTRALLLLVILTHAASAKELHVAVKGSNDNDGSAAKPLKTISVAAQLAQPGDVITVHEGIYRETVAPPRGGTSEAQRIVYQAAAGEKVTITGSEPIKNWVKVQDSVWKAVVPNALFGGFNPYSDVIQGDWFNPRGRVHHTGAVYLNGDWLIEAAALDDVLASGKAKPAVDEKGHRPVLLNVEWLQAGEAASGKSIPATRFVAHQGTRAAPCSEGGECLGWISDGDWLRYEHVNLGQHTQQLEIRAASASEGGIVEVRLDSPDGKLLGACTVPNTGGWQSWSTFKARIEPLGGVKTLCLVFKSQQTDALSAGLWYGQVDATNTTIWAQFKDINPNEQSVEINVRRTVFYPQKTGVNYLTVRGFTLQNAATPWAPPTAEQVGLIGAHWSRGWIIEDNVISHSICCGISLGKYGDEFDNTSANSAEGYVKTIDRALANGWNKETIGHHIVQRNTISHCEQAGIVGSLGAAFSVVTGNTIHDIHVRRLFSGAEMAGIKFHAAIDVEISHNHIYRTVRGLWLDWMAQGTRVSSNLFHDNASEDLFVEVDHGPFLVDNNIFLSPRTLLSHSQGGAFVHNLMPGGMIVNSFDSRLTPFHKPHSTEVAGLHDNPNGDDRYYNNVFGDRGNLAQYDSARLPVAMEGNVFLQGAKPSKYENQPIIDAKFDPALKLIECPDGYCLEMHFDKAWTTERTRKVVNTDLLGKAVIPNALYEAADGSPIRISTDYFGKPRNEANPTPGPIESPGQGNVKIKVW